MQSVSTLFKAFVIRKFRKIFPRSFTRTEMNTNLPDVMSMIELLDVNGNSLTHIAARDGNESMLHMSLSIGCNVNQLNSHGETPLLCANYGEPKIISSLLDADADVSVTNSMERSPLHLAVLAANAKSIKLILDAGVDLDTRDRYDKTALHLAVLSDDDLEIVKMLVEAGSNINNGVLITAAQSGNEAIIHYLLDMGASATQTAANGITALHFSVTFPDTRVTRRLIELGADVNHQDLDGFSPLHEATYDGKLSQVELLLEHGANIRIKTYDNETPLHWATCSGTPDYAGVIEFLLKHNSADVNDPDETGTTAFLFALRKASLELTQLFVSYGADFKVKSARGESAIHFASENPSVEVMCYVLKQGFDVNESTNAGFTALHLAAEAGNYEICELLLRRGARVNVKCSEGTPLYLAVGMQRCAIVALLLEYGADEFDVRVSGQTSFEAALLNYNNDKIVDTLVAHMARLTYLKKAVNESDRALIEYHCHLSDFFHECLVELAFMESAKFYNDVSLLDIFTERKSVVSGYARNEELISAFSLDKDRSKSIPVYCEYVRNKFFKEVRRQRLLKTVASLVSNILALNDPCHLVVRKIVTYLSDDDLKGFANVSE